MTSPSTVLPVRETYRAITRAVVPASADLDEAGWRRAEQIVDAALLDRPASVRRQLVLFVKGLGAMALLRHGRSLSRLEPETARAFLRGFERSRLLLIRRGFWGIRTLAYMGYYGQKTVRDRLGYAADPGGWDARGGGQGPWAARGGAGPPEPSTLTADGEEEPRA
jgi:hypothetical protein